MLSIVNANEMLNCHFSLIGKYRFVIYVVESLMKGKSKWILKFLH